MRATPLLIALICAPFGGCGEARTAAPKTRSSATAAKNLDAGRAHTINRGTGSLAGNHFAVPPIVTSRTYTDERGLTTRSFAFYARLVRDVPRSRSGDPRIVFGLSGVEFGVEDPVGRISRSRFCFSQVAGVERPPPSLPGPGDTVDLTLRAYGARGQSTGSLTTHVRLRQPESLESQNNGYGPNPFAAKIGCAK